MPATEKNIVLERGTDYEAVGYLDDDGVGEDIQNDTFKGACKHEYDDVDGDVIADFTYVIFEDTNDLDSNSDPRWKYRRTMAKEVIDAIDAGIEYGVWDQFRILSDGTYTRQLYGVVEIRPRVTPP